jgi:gas vesicle protein
MSIKQLQIDILAKDKTLRAFDSVNRGLSSVQQRVFNLRNALIGIGGATVLKGFLDAGIEVENLGIQLKALFGSAEAGAKALQQVTKFASETPFELRNIQQGVTALATVADKAEEMGISFDELLKITGNTAVQLGGDFAQASLNIQKSFSAGIGSADLFRDRAVTAMAGFEAGVKVSVDESIKGLAKAFGTGGQYGQLTKELSETTFGTISNLKDAFFQFQVAVSSGFFPALKRELGDLKKVVEDNQESIQDFGEAVGTNLVKAFERGKQVADDLKKPMENIAKAFNSIIDGFLLLPPEIQNYGVIVGLLLGKKGIMALGVVSGARSLIEKYQLQIENFMTTGRYYATKLFEQIGLIAEGSADKVFQELLDIRAKLSEQINEINNDAPNVIIPVTLNGTDELDEDLKEVKKNIDGLSEAIKGFQSGFKTAMDEAIKITDDFEKLGKKAFDGFADSLTDAIMTGKANFKDFARSLLADLLRIIIRQQLAVQLQRILGFGSAVSGGGGIIASIPKLFGFANGGTPPVNRPSIIGERGAELFIPKSSGTVVPNEDLKGIGGTTNINFTINTVDAQGVDQLLTNRRSTIINVINDALNRQGKEALV